MVPSLLNTRASRSRRSSPQVPNGSAQSAKAGGISNSKGFMENWLEPPVQKKASYEQEGLIRHGTVESMHALGTLPPTVKKAAGPEQTPTRKIIIKRPNTTQNTPTPAIVTPASAEEDDDDEMAAEPEPEPLSAPPAARRSLLSREVDEDYEPKASVPHSAGRVKVTRRSLGGRPSPRRLGSGSLQAATANGVTQSDDDDDDKDTVDKVVELAVDEALRHFRYPTAWALRTLYDENSQNRQILSMFEDVMHQTAEPETLEEFAKLIHEKKKEGKKDNKGCYYFVPPPTSSHFTPHKPKAAPYGNLVRFEVPKLNLDPGPDPDFEAPVRKKLKSSKHHHHHHRSPLAKMADANRANGSAAASPSSARKKRAQRERQERESSVSSSSSLSSARSLSPPVNDDDVFGVPPPSDGAEGSNAAAAPQPIATRRRSGPAKKNGRHSPAPKTISPSDTTLEAAVPGMPAAVDDAIFPNLTSKKGRNGKEASPALFPVKFTSKVGHLDDNDVKSRMRQNSRNVTNSIGDIPESFTRGGSLRVDLDFDVDGPPPPPPGVLQRQARASTLRNTRSSRKRSHDEVDDEASPTALLFPPPPEFASSTLNSRAGTPGPRAKKPRTGLRVKNSPMKKKDGPSAGVPRASGERGSPVANGAPNNQDDNDDYCSSCGGNGELVCCDGCTRSFHFQCVDPPLQEEAAPDDWYCNVCLSSRHPSDLTQTSGTFSFLMKNLEKKNSSAFRLPDHVRDFFDGVKAGVDGEYEDVVLPAPKPKKKGVYDDAPDFFKVRDADGNAVLCQSCHRSAAANRAIIPCSACGDHWHIDCLDPPMANPPPLRNWKCPAHVEDLQAKVAGPSHKWRRVRGAAEIKPAYGRGLANNGFIEVDDSGSESETGWNEYKTFGRVYRLPAKGIKLDFIHRIHQARQSSSSNTQPASQPVIEAESQTTPSSARFDQRRSIAETQAALNLAALSASEQPLDHLLKALVSKADADVLALMNKGDAPTIKSVQDTATAESLTSDDVQALQAMQARISHLLKLAAGVQTSKPAQPEESGLSSQVTVESQPETSSRLSTRETSEIVMDKALSPGGELPSSPIRGKTIPASDDDDTEIDDAPIATPGTAANEKPLEPLVAVATTDLPPGEPEIGPSPKAPAPTVPDKLETKDVMPTPSTSPTVNQQDAPRPAAGEQPSERVLSFPDDDRTESEDWAMDLD